LADDLAVEDEQVIDAIANLRASDREVFYLIVWDELDNQTAARVLGCSANTVAVRLHRARARLRAQLERSQNDEPVMTDDVPGITKES
jgi:RNA polymerase sigma-70 factor (ECF subfamily)